MNQFNLNKGNPAKQIELLPQVLWKEIVLEDKEKCRSHACVLIKKGLTTSGWNCDKIPGMSKCFSGLTGFYQSTHIMNWSCRKCDFDFCIACLQVDKLYESLLEEKEE